MAIILPDFFLHILKLKFLNNGFKHTLLFYQFIIQKTIMSLHKKDNPPCPADCLNNTFIQLLYYITAPLLTKNKILNRQKFFSVFRYIIYITRTKKEILRQHLFSVFTCLFLYVFHTAPQAYSRTSCLLFRPLPF